MNKPKMYHGHTIIELKDVASGKRERIEHDNDFTDNMALYLSGGGYFNNSPWANTDWMSVARYHRLIGGILLFDKEIEPVDGHYPLFAPAGTKMIANGSYNVTNNGTTTEFGSYNAAESSFTSNALTYVYDWTTSQGNGEIASICLTSEIGGYIGYGNSTSNTGMSTKRSIYHNQTSNQLSTDSNYTYNVVDGTMYRASNTATNNLSLTTINVPINGASLFTNDITETVNLPSTFVGNSANFVMPVYGVGFAVIKCTMLGSYKQVAVDTTAPVGIYNVKSKSWTTRTIKASSSNPIIFFSNSNMGGIYGDWVVGFQNGTSATANRGRTKLDTYEYASYSTDTISTVGLSEDLFLTTGNNGTAYYMVDNVNGTAYPTNGNTGGNGGGVSDGIGMYLGANYASNIYRYRNPLYLATVNNLDDVVTKTSNLTMKVTYIVTREE